MSAKHFLTNEKLHALFKHFDTDNSGVISMDNIREAMGKAGKQISKEELSDILKKHDYEKNNVITFEEFKTMMLGEEISVANMDRSGSVGMGSAFRNSKKFD